MENIVCVFVSFLHKFDDKQIDSYSFRRYTMNFKKDSVVSFSYNRGNLFKRCMVLALCYSRRSLARGSQDRGS